MHPKYGSDSAYGAYKTGKVGVGEAPKLLMLKVADIHFSQATIGKTFSNGIALKDVTHGLLNGTLKAEEFPSIRVVKHRGMWYALDNRRLRVFKDALISEICVVECNLHHDEAIKKEFFSKLNNKTLEAGGIERGCSTPATDHFDSGAYKFIAEILNWNFEQIKEPFPLTKRLAPLPNKFSSLSHYYESFLPLILEETRAILHAGLEAAAMAGAKFMKLTVAKPFKRPKNPKNPIGFTFDKNLKTLLPIKSSDALLLVCEDEPDIHLLGIASQVNDDNPAEPKLIAKVVVDEYDYSRYGDAFNENAKWRVYPLGTVVSQMRMYDACKSAPTIPLADSVLGGESEDAMERLTHSISSMGLYGSSRYGYAMSSVLSAKKETSISSTETSLLSHLNASQQNAINKFLKKDSGIELIHGPPGTGKTTTITTLLKILYDRKERTLVCAPSNKAVQLLAERFLADNPDAAVAFAGVEEKLPPDNAALNAVFIHTYGEDKLNRLAEIDAEIWRLVPSEELLDRTTTVLEKNKWSQAAAKRLSDIKHNFAGIVAELHLYQFGFLTSLDEVFDKYEKCAEAYHSFIENVAYGRMLSKAKSELSIMAQCIHALQRYIQKKVADDSKAGLEGQMLDRAILIFATLSVAGRKSFKEMDKVSALIIDEAGQAVEAETLIPFTSKPKHCLLIGDIKQLPATIISTEAEKLNYRRSLMERLIEGCHQSFSLLDEQYRMHPDISAWPSAKYYNGKLKNALSVHPRMRTLPELAAAPAYLAPYSFIDTPGVESTGGSTGHSYTNLVEAKLVARIIYTLDSKYKINVTEQVGVITFYKGQVELINTTLKPHFPEVKVNTVDGFQGGESDIIVISFVRANDRGSIGFVDDFRRLNVALTRARYSVIMLGHAKTLERKVHDVAELIYDAKRRSRFFTSDIVERHLLDSTPTKIASTALSSKVCRFYNGAPGSCRKGDGCDFTHMSTSTLASAKASSSLAFTPIVTAAKKEPKTKTQLCRHFNGEAGSCRFGDDCKFAHGSHDLATASVFAGAGFTKVGPSSGYDSSYEDDSSDSIPVSYYNDYYDDYDYYY